MDPRFESIEFTNSNKKAPVKIVRGSIAGFDYNKPTACNVIYTIGGVFPVQETLEEIEKKINVTAPEAQEKTDVRATAVRHTSNVRKREESSHGRKG